MHPLTRSLVCCLTLAPLLAASAGRYRPQIEAMQQEVARLQQQVEQLQQQVSERDGQAGRLAQHCHLRLTGFRSRIDRFGQLEKADLQLQLRHCADAWFAHAARVGSDDQAHPVEIVALTLDQERLSGQLIIHWRGAKGGKDLSPHAAEYRDQTIPITLDLQVDGDRLQGSYQTPGAGGGSEHLPVPPRTGSCRGELQRATATPSPRPEAPSINDLLGPERVAWRSAVYAEEQARWLYHRLQVLRLAEMLDLPTSHTSHLLPWRPCQATDPFAVSGDEQKIKVKQEAKTPPRPDITDAGIGGDMDDLGGALDDAFDDLGELEEDLDALETDAFDAATLRRFEDGLLAIGDRIARRVAFATASPSAKPVPPARTVSDRRFGPYWGSALPPADPDGQRVPDRDGSEPRWGRVDSWRIVGPYPRLDHQHRLENLPPILLDPTATYGYERDRWGKSVTGLAASAQPVSARRSADPGWSRLPGWGSFDDHGSHPRDLDWTTTYWQTHLEATEARDCWWGITCSDDASLWLNGRLVWRTPAARDSRQQLGTWVFEAPLHEGRNHLLLQLDHGERLAAVDLRLAWQGGPLSGPEADDRDRRIAARLAQAGNPVGAARGWRVDGTGRAPAADPPIAWDWEAGTNVRWRKPLPPGHATPLVSGDRLFVTVEPYTVLCLDRATGDERWRRHLDPIALHHPEALERSRAAHEAATAAWNALLALGAHNGERVAALVGQGTAEDEAKARIKELNKAARSWTGDGSWVSRKLDLESASWNDLTGHMYATPVLEGERLWVTSNTGSIACLDLDGSIVWHRAHGSNTGSVGNIPSLVKVGDLVIRTGPEPERRNDNKHMRMEHVAYDAASGAERWRCRSPTPGDRSGTPVALHISDGERVVPVLATASGAVIRVSDGERLCDDLGSFEHYGSPISDHRGRIYFTGQSEGHAHKTAIELLLGSDGALGLRHIWRVSHPNTGQCGNYAVLDGDYHYAFRPNLDVLHRRTGELELIGGQSLYCRAGRAYSPILFAGGRLYVSDNSTWFTRGHPFHSGLSAIEAAPDGLVLARNKVDRRLHGGIGIADDQLFIRTIGSIACLQITDEAGWRYQAETVAREVLAPVWPDDPGLPEVLTCEPLSSPTARGPVLTAGGPPRRALLIGPVAAQASTELVAALQAVDGWWQGEHKEKTQLHLAGQDHACKALNRYNRDRWLPGGHFDTAALSDPLADEQVAIFASIVTVDFDRHFRLACSDTIQLHLGGRRLHHGDLIHLPAGQYCLTVVLNGTAGQKLHFWPSKGPKADRASWCAHIQRVRPYLQEAIRRSPTSPIGERAARCLAQARE